MHETHGNIIMPKLPYSTPLPLTLLSTASKSDCSLLYQRQCNNTECPGELRLVNPIHMQRRFPYVSSAPLHGRTSGRLRLHHILRRAAGRDGSCTCILPAATLETIVRLAMFDDDFPIRSRARYNMHGHRILGVRHVVK